MAQSMFEEVRRLAEQLTPEEQQALIEYLQGKHAEQRQTFHLPVIDLGPWPEGLSLRREDWYEDDGR